MSFYNNKMNINDQNDGQNNRNKDIKTVFFSLGFGTH